VIPMQNQEQIPIPFLERTDAVLAKQAMAGDQEAFERLAQRYHVALFNFICRFLGNDDVACDVLQHVFLRFYASLPRLGTGEPFKIWLFQVAHTSCVDRLRRIYPLHFSQSEKSEDWLVDLSGRADSEPLSVEMAERSDVQALLQQTIETLPPTLRSVTVMHYVSQMSFVEIGQVLSLSEEKVLATFRRANRLLRHNMKKIAQRSMGQIIIHEQDDLLELNGFLLQVGDRVEILHLSSWIPGLVAHDEEGWHLLAGEVADISLQTGHLARLLALEV
jgi:RNA polymerase sigma factor (sigma-70 family)